MDQSTDLSVGIPSFELIQVAFFEEKNSPDQKDRNNKNSNETEKNLEKEKLVKKLKDFEKKIALAEKQN